MTLPTIRRRLRPTTRAAAAAAAAVGLGAVGIFAGDAAAGAATSNGISSKPATTIVATGARTTKGASSFRVAGHITVVGTTIAFNVTDGGNGSGSGTLAVEGLGAKFVKVGTTVYVLANASFWRRAGGAAAAKAYAGKWVKSPASNSSLKSAVQFLTGHQFFGSLSLTPSGLTLHKSGTTRLGGQTVVVVTGRAKATGSSGAVRYLVAATGRPYLLEVNGTERADTTSASVSVRFSNLGQPVKVSAPSKSIPITTVATTTTTSTTGSAG